MLIKDCEVKIIKCEHKQGTSSKGKPYSMYVMEIVDNEYNKFQVTVPNSVLVEGIVPEWLLEAENLDAQMDINVVPRGYGVALNVLEINEK